MQQRKRRGGGKSPLFHPILFPVGEGGETRDCGANKSTFPSHDWRHISLPVYYYYTGPNDPSPDKKIPLLRLLPLRDICCRIWAIRYSLPRQQCRERCYLPALGFFFSPWSVLFWGPATSKNRSNGARGSKMLLNDPPNKTGKEWEEEEVGEGITPF